METTYTSKKHTTQRNNKGYQVFICFYQRIIYSQTLEAALFLKEDSAKHTLTDNHQHHDFVCRMPGGDMCKCQNLNTLEIVNHESTIRVSLKRNSVFFFAALRPQPQAAALHVLSFLARMKIATNWIETMPFVWNFKGHILGGLLAQLGIGSLTELQKAYVACPATVLREGRGRANADRHPRYLAFIKTYQHLICLLFSSIILYLHLPLCWMTQHCSSNFYVTTNHT